MASVTLKNVSKVYGSNIQAVKNTTLEIKDKEFLVLVGPSGCGKTTMIRLISGLEEATTGDLFIDSRRINDVSPKDRDIAMVFQSYALYPHMSVFENMAFGLQLRKIPKNEIRRRVEDVSHLLELEPLLSRKPRELSGGQRQRVAMGRAIVREPKVFLMDEPLSNLDAQLRSQMRVELQKLHRRLGITTIYVTHDQTEAITLGSQIAVMKEGAIQQIGTPMEIYERPANFFVASFIGNPPMNFLEVSVSSNGNEASLTAPDFKMNFVNSKLAGHKSVLLGVRPEDIKLGPTDSAIRGKVEAVEWLGSESYIHFTLGQKRWTAKADPTLQTNPGDPIGIKIDSARLHAFDLASGKTLPQVAAKNLF